MNVLVVGGNGYVGSIFLPVLDAAHRCQVLDMKFNPARTTNCLIGDACDAGTAELAMMGQDCVIHCALGVRALYPNETDTIESAFRAHVESVYVMLHAARRAGVRRFIYVSSLSVYERIGKRTRFLDESVPPDEWRPYGFSKRAGEYVCQAFSQHFSSMSILSLRLMYPRNEADWPGNESVPGALWHPLGPNDTRDLFVAAVAYEQPGFTVVQASGDLTQSVYGCEGVRRALGWMPKGR